MNSLPQQAPGGVKIARVSVKNGVDDMVNSLIVLSEGSEKQFLQFANDLKLWVGERMAHMAEIAMLQAELIKSQTQVAALEKKLKQAQHLLGIEKEKRVASEHQVKQIFLIMERLKGGESRGDAPHQEQLMSLLSSTLEGGSLMGSSYDGGRRAGAADSVLSPRAPLSTIDESCDTLNAISDIDLTDGDELEVSSLLHSTGVSPDKRRSSRKRRSCSPDINRRKPKRSQQNQGSDDCRDALLPSTTGLTTTTTSATSTFIYQPSAPPLVAPPDEWAIGRTPTAAVRRQAPMPPTPQVSTPHSQYSTPSQNSPLVRSHMSLSRAHTRTHCFYTKTIYMSEQCQPCRKRVKFGRVVLKCRDCRAVCHQECRDAVPLPCVPTVTTPGSKHHMGIISDYTPTVCPMVPALIVHCTIEVEQRGVAEVGIYRISALERDVKELKDKFLRGKGIPNLSNVDVHTICCTVKHFLRSLKEPLITLSLWQQFVSAANKKEDADCEAALYQAITDLPQPNRDTLSWMMLHLQRMSEATECLMSIDNFAKVFGPTLVGYSMFDPEPEMVLLQTSDQQTVMSKLLSLSRDYWETFTLVTNENLFSGSLAEALTPTDGKAGGNRRRSIISRMPLQ